MHNAPPPQNLYLASVYLRPLLDYLRARSLPLGPVLAAMRCTEAESANPDHYLQADVPNDAFAAAAALSGDSDIGVLAGQTMRPLNMGVLGHLLMTSVTATEMASLHFRYGKLVGNSAWLEYAFEGDSLRMTLRQVPELPRYSRQVLEYSLGGWVAVTRWLLGANYPIDEIVFPFAEPADTRAQQLHFNCPLKFDASAENMVMTIPRSLENLPMPSAHDSVREVLRQDARKRLLALRGEQIDSDPQLKKLRQLLADRMSFGPLDLGTAAGAIDASPRQLQRLLEARNTSYKEFADGVRRELAARYIKDASLSLTDIALMLGFSEQSTFQRAFKRWFETTPNSYRLTLR